VIGACFRLAVPLDAGSNWLLQGWADLGSLSICLPHNIFMPYNHTRPYAWLTNWYMLGHSIQSPLVRHSHSSCTPDGLGGVLTVQ